MARREGTTYTISEIINKGYNPLSFRYLALTAHYRSRLNFTWDSLQSADTTLNNLYREISGYAAESEAKIARLPLPKGEAFGGQGCAEYEQNFLEAVNDDLDPPKALSIVWALVDSNYPASAKLKSLLKFDEVLGLDLEKVAKESKEVPEEIKKLLGQREEARKSDDFKKSDEIREKINSKGYEVIDTKDGQKLKKLKL